MKRPKTDIRLGDKVNVRLDEGGSRIRGRVESLDGTLAVLLESGKSLKVTAGELTNYSSAARKVWASTPNRRVGPTEGKRITDRISITIRVDRRLWRAFESLEESGAISDRTVWPNNVIRQGIEWLDPTRHRLD